MKDIIGHEQLIAHFQALHQDDRLAQSYLFMGPARIGKRTVARYLIQSFLCTGSQSTDSLFATNEKPEKPCLSCDSCKHFSQGTHPDYLYLSKPEDKQSISVEAIRGAIQQAYRSPVFQTRKFLLINKADTMTVQASNALLKTLEEPPSSCAIFLLTENPEYLPQTILSRCELFDLSSISVTIASEEKKRWEMSTRLPGNFVLLNQDESFQELYKNELQLFIEFVSSPIARRIQLLDELLKKGKKSHQEKKSQWEQRLQFWKIFFRDILMVKLHAEDILSTSHIKQVDSSRLSLNSLISIQDEISKILSDIQKSYNLRLRLEKLLLHV